MQYSTESNPVMSNKIGYMSSKHMCMKSPTATSILQWKYGSQVIIMWSTKQDTNTHYIERIMNILRTKININITYLCKILQQAEQAELMYWSGKWTNTSNGQRCLISYLWANVNNYHHWN